MGWATKPDPLVRSRRGRPGLRLLPNDAAYHPIDGVRRLAGGAHRLDDGARRSHDGARRRLDDDGPPSPERPRQRDSKPLGSPVARTSWDEMHVGSVTSVHDSEIGEPSRGARSPGASVDQGAIARKPLSAKGGNQLRRRKPTAVEPRKQHHRCRADGTLAPSGRPSLSQCRNRGPYSDTRMCNSRSCRESTAPGAPVIRSDPLAVLGKAMQSRMLVKPP